MISTVKAIKAITAITLCVLLSMKVCGFVVKSRAIATTTIENQAIPYDFGRENSTLLCILKGDKNYDQYMKTNVSQHFSGKYIFISEEELKQEKYDDLSKYRFVFNIDKQEYQTNHGHFYKKRYQLEDLRVAAYSIYDRKEEIKYVSSIKSSYYSKLIEAYMINLEKARLDNYLHPGKNFATVRTNYPALKN